MEFIDLKQQYERLKPRIHERIDQVLEHGKFIMGPEVAELEKNLAAFVGATHCVSCSNGTDALLLGLMAHDVGPGDAVFTTPFTFIATAEVVCLLGATPVFVDIDPDTYNIDPGKLERTIAETKEGKDPFRGRQNRLNPKGIIAVDLFGLPADYDAINRIAGQHGLFVMEDAAQSLGGSYRGKRVGNVTDIAATSFFPAKPLGGYGDGGAIFTNDETLANCLRTLREHGKGSHKYDNVRIGINGRLDTLQAAILLSKLEIFESEIKNAPGYCRPVFIRVERVRSSPFCSRWPCISLGAIFRSHGSPRSLPRYAQKKRDSDSHLLSSTASSADGVCSSGLSRGGLSRFRADVRARLQSSDASIPDRRGSRTNHRCGSECTRRDPEDLSMYPMVYPNEAAPGRQQPTVVGPFHVSVCVCTFKRPIMLRRLLEKVVEQDTNGLFSFSIVVVDNDRAESARKVVETFASTAQFELCYFSEPRQSFALARNRAVEQATGNFVAFIDDDEFPSRQWLLNLFNTCIAYNAAGVLGPVKPYFTQTPPGWLVKGKFAERAAFETGYILDWRQSRTGNVLFKKEIIEGEQETFRTQFGTGGEDVDFFQRMMRKGFVFVWCNEADVFEEVPPDRCTRKYLLRRALLRGKNTFEREGIRLGSAGKSILAMSLYGFFFPFLLAMGQHWYMKYAIKFSDHAGKLLAIIGFNLVRER